MTKPPIKTQQAADYLRNRPHLHMLGGKRLVALLPELNIAVKTWQRARDLLGLKPIPRGGSIRRNWQERATKPFVAYPDVLWIEVDKPLKTIRYVSSSGIREVVKSSRLKLAASIRLIEARGYVVISERGGVVAYKQSDTGVTE